MHYFGGKGRTCKPITQLINTYLTTGQQYWEPFVGSGWVMANINPSAKRLGSDACGPLIAMFQRLQEGWQPPDDVTPEMYQQAKAGQCSPELTAFIGFGCSFAGKWFGGHAHSASRNYALNAKNSLAKKMKGLLGVTFKAANYLELEIPSGAVIYCDPPYAGTTAYGAVPTFDTSLFHDWARRASVHNKIFISEYQMPADFKVVLEIPTKLDIRNKEGIKEPRLERVFTL